MILYITLNIFICLLVVALARSLACHVLVTLPLVRLLRAQRPIAVPAVRVLRLATRVHVLRSEPSMANNAALVVNAHHVLQVLL